MDIPHYSHIKFKAMSPDRRQRTIDKLLIELESSIQDWERVCALRDEIALHLDDLDDRTLCELIGQI